MELELEGTIRDPTAPLQEVQDLIEHGIEVHEHLLSVRRTFPGHGLGTVELVQSYTPDGWQRKVFFRLRVQGAV
jgi:hypothetical protein